MGAGKKIKILVGVLSVVLLAFFCLSGPVKEGDDSVRPLFGTVKIQLSSGRYNVDSKVLTAVLESGETEYLHLFHNLEAADFSGSSCYEEIAAWARDNPQVTVKYTVDLPDGVASIGDFALGWCQNLSSLTVRVADPATIELGLIPFFRGANAVDCTLRVPVGSKTKYENADLWKDFAPNIEELTSDGIDNATTEGQQADKAERVYSRDGVQLRGTLSQQQKGVYIVGGKKVVKR